MSKKKVQEGSLGDQLNTDVLSKLRSKKTELKRQEEIRQEEERKRRLEEKKRQEANKSFEELLNESDLNWKTFKE
ncbi:YqkE family protein [Halobacillus mangrovi]|uniref:YqkE family protein n=1 Tax=Halobacillus mangrovi TaxID=402384 RepID=UPI003D96B4D4